MLLLAIQALCMGTAFVGGASAQGLGPFVDTTVADFSTCSTRTATAVTNTGGGEVRLVASVEDYFDGPGVDTSIWWPETYSGASTTPVVNGGILTVNSSAVVSL